MALKSTIPNPVGGGGGLTDDLYNSLRQSWTTKGC